MSGRSTSRSTRTTSRARPDRGDKPLRDVVGPDLTVLFTGINPSLRSAEVGHHFARPGNRFWPAIHLAGFTPRRMEPDEDGELPRYGVGVTNLGGRPVWVLPNPSGLNAHHQLPDLAERYREARAFAQTL